MSIRSIPVRISLTTNIVSHLFDHKSKMRNIQIHVLIMTTVSLFAALHENKLTLNKNYII
jgi:hypothetical protein